jgi:hypothetical protein
MLTSKAYNFEDELRIVDVDVDTAQTAEQQTGVECAWLYTQ